MGSLALEPSLNQLNKLISQVSAYPVSIADLLNLARLTRQPKEVLDFYATFQPDQVFNDPDDLQSRSEQVEILRHVKHDMPPDQQIAAEEY